MILFENTIKAEIGRAWGFYLQVLIAKQNITQNVIPILKWDKKFISFESFDFTYLMVSSYYTLFFLTKNIIILQAQQL